MKRLLAGAAGAGLLLAVLRYAAVIREAAGLAAAAVAGLAAVLAGAGLARQLRRPASPACRSRLPGRTAPAASRLEREPQEPAGRLPESLRPAGPDCRAQAIRPGDREWGLLRPRPPAAPDNEPAGADPAWAEFAARHDVTREAGA